MVRHLSVSQKLWSLAQFLYQYSALGLKSYKWSQAAKIALEPSIFNVEMSYGSFKKPQTMGNSNLYQILRNSKSLVQKKLKQCQS